jgi:hypothetical protein
MVLPADPGRQQLLDVGGGSGAIAIELCQARPGLTATIFDLPHVACFAARKIAAAGLPAGSAPPPVTRSHPAGHDVALLSLILHSFTPDQDRLILARTFCLPGGGLVLVTELLVNDDKTGPPPRADEPDHARGGRGPQLHRRRIRAMAH